MPIIVATLLVLLIVIGALAPAPTFGAPNTSAAPSAPAKPAAPAKPDLCEKAGAEWSKGIVTQYPWKRISSRNGFEVTYCIVRETTANHDQAIVRFTNMAPVPLWLKVRTFYKLSSGRQVERSTMIARVKPREFVTQILTHSQTNPGEQVKEIGFHDMQVSDKEIK